MRRSLVGTLTAVALIMAAGVARADVVFGVIAPSGELQAAQEWTPLAERLSAELGEPVKLMPLGTAQVLERFRAGELDAMLTNPVQSAIAQKEGASLIASYESTSGKQLAGVIVANPAAGIATVADLRGKKLITPPTESAGAFICPAALAIQHGVSIPGDLAVHKIGKNQIDLIRLVEKGAFDVAFVRSGILEKAVAAGDVDPAKVVVVNEQTVEGFPDRHSTVLYPEWYVVGAAHLDAERAARLKAALLAIEPRSLAANPRFVQFHEPLDITPIVEALRAVGMAPFGS